MLKLFPKLTPLLRKIKKAIVTPFTELFVLNNINKNTVSLHELSKSSRPITIFWAIDSGIKYHFISHCILAKTLQTLNEPVALLRCHKNLKRCTVMDSLNTAPHLNILERTQICSSCTKISIDYASAYELPVLKISDLIPNKKYSDIANQLDNVENITHFIYDNIDFGKIALGEVYRTRKIYGDDLTEDERAHVKTHILGMIANYLAFDALRQTLPINRVIYFGDYGNILGVAACAKKASIPITNLSHALVNNVRRSNIIFGKAYSTQEQFDKLTKWENLKTYSLTRERVELIGNDLLNRISKGGFTIYSPVKSLESNELYSRLNLDPSKKLLVAFTSSLDEAEATILQYQGLSEPPLPEDNPFKNQIDWLQHLNTFAQENQYQLVVRIHPREGTDMYRDKQSKHLLQLKRAFSTLPQQVKFIWPGDKISSYDLGELADLVLISWTSMGVEFARFGAPVLAAFQYCPYPKDDVILWASTKKEYFEKIHAYLDDPKCTIDRIIYAFRWFNLIRLGSSIDISDISFPDDPLTTLPPFKMPKHAKDIKSILIDNHDVLDINYKTLQSDPKHEQEAIRNFIKKSIWYLFTGVLREKPFELFVLPGNKTNHSTKNINIVERQPNNKVTLYTCDKVFSKQSPLISRMITLL